MSGISCPIVVCLAISLFDATTQSLSTWNNYNNDWIVSPVVPSPRHARCGDVPPLSPISVENDLTEITLIVHILKCLGSNLSASNLLKYIGFQHVPKRFMQYLPYIV